jgi:Icc-related predicted phosphoesterase
MKGNKNRRVVFSSDFHGNLNMLETFLSYSVNDLDGDYIILGGDIGPRGESAGDKETVEYHHGEMMKQKRWFQEQFCELVEKYFPHRGEEEKQKRKRKLFIVLGNSDWQVNEAVLKQKFSFPLENDSVKVCS